MFKILYLPEATYIKYATRKNKYVDLCFGDYDSANTYLTTSVFIFNGKVASIVSDKWGRYRAEDIPEYLLEVVEI